MSSSTRVGAQFTVVGSDGAALEAENRVLGDADRQKGCGMGGDTSRAVVQLEYEVTEQANTILTCCPRFEMARDLFVGDIYTVFLNTSHSSS
jgi:hypothetical protein